MQVACLRCLPARKPLRRFSTLRRFPPFLPCRTPIQSISDTHPVDIGHRSGPNRTPFRSHQKTVRHQPGRLSGFNRNAVRFESERCPTSNRIGVRFASEYAAKAQGISKSTVQRIWDDHQLKPHLTRSFKLSRDPHFVEKLTDIIGVYLTPPQNAIVLCVDENSQIQALDRTQPGLPLKPGRCGTFTHDYKRHGTTTLFAALQVAEGRVIGECYQRHRHQEFLRFLKRLDRELPSGKALHLILDNYGTHGHPKVREWLARHPRFVLHFIPTSSSWLNLVERWFAELTQKSVRRGSFHSVDDLEQAIAAFLDAWNANPTPFVWTASVEKILEKVERCRRRLDQIEPGCAALKRPRPTPPQSG